jgi:hypothetical protein
LISEGTPKAKETTKIAARETNLKIGGGSENRTFMTTSKENFSGSAKKGEAIETKINESNS